MRFFDFTKWPKIAKTTQDDLLTLELVSFEPLGNTEQNTLLVFLKIHYIYRNRAKNDFDGNHAYYSL